MALASKQTHRSTEQNREPRNKHTYGHLIYNKGAKNIQWENTVSSTNGIRGTGQLHVKE